MQPHRHRLPQEPHPLLLRMLVFKIKRRHALSFAPIHNGHILGAQPPRSIRRIDRRIAGANHCHLAGCACNLCRLICRNELQRIHHTGVISARNLQPMPRSQAHANKNQIKILFDPRQLLRINLHAKPKLDAQLFDQLNLAQARPRRQLVLRHSVRIQPARQRHAARTPSPQSPAAPALPRTPAMPAPRRCTRLCLHVFLQIFATACRRAHETHPSQTAAAARSQSAARCDDSSRTRLRTAHPPDTPASNSPPAHSHPESSAPIRSDSRWQFS